MAIPPCKVALEAALDAMKRRDAINQKMAFEASAVRTIPNTLTPPHALTHTHTCSAPTTSTGSAVQGTRDDQPRVHRH